jgi:DNA-binding CsgD family transcriptional regulator
VRIAVELDADAARIAAVLEALGYTVVRDLEPAGRLDWAVSKIARDYKLAARDRDVLALMLAGKANPVIADELGLSRATVKWHRHVIFTKTATETTEALLRLALQLPDLAVEPKTTLEIDPSSDPAVCAALGLAHPGNAQQLTDLDRRSVAVVPSKSWF